MLVKNCVVSDGGSSTELVLDERGYIYIFFNKLNMLNIIIFYLKKYFIIIFIYDALLFKV